MPVPPPGIDRQAWREVWPEILEQAERQRRRLAPYRLLNAVAAGLLRPRLQSVIDARRLVSELGDSVEAWVLAQQAARVATRAAAIEWNLDQAVRRVA